jgi:NAD+ synthase (glutamine-hydrolysing)
VTLWADLAGCLANLADLWKTQVYQVARYINSTSEQHGMHIPEDVFQIRPSAELSSSQDIEQGAGDPFDYEQYHDYLFASWIERWNRATPEDLLSWYLDGTIEQELGCKVYERFPDVKDFIDDLEQWWNKFDGIAVSKRVVAPCILAVTRRAYGFDMRESQGKPYYSKSYLDLKASILGK